MKYKLQPRMSGDKQGFVNELENGSLLTVTDEDGVVTLARRHPGDRALARLRTRYSVVAVEQVPEAIEQLFDTFSERKEEVKAAEVEAALEAEVVPEGTPVSRDPDPVPKPEPPATEPEAIVAVEESEPEKKEVVDGQPA